MLGLCLLLLSGCGIFNSSPHNTLLPESRPEPDIKDSGIYEPVVTVTVSGYQAGFTASYYVEIHNAAYSTEKFYSQVNPATMTDFAPLSKKLYDNSISSIIRIEDEKSNLYPISYDIKTKYLTIGNFTSVEQSTFSVAYYYENPTKYNLSYQIPYDLTEGYSAPPEQCKDWIRMPKNITISPFMTVAVPISLQIPKNTALESNKFEFWIIIREEPANSTSSPVTIERQYVQKWLIELT